VTRHRPRAAWLSLALGLALVACSSAGSTGGNTGGTAAPPAHWVRFRHLPGVVDLAGPGRDGGFTVAAAGRLFTLSQAGTLRPFARGPGGYTTAIGPEPYLTMPAAGHVAGTTCSFPRGAIFAIQPGQPPGVIMVGADGRATRLASLPGTLTPNGITADTVGRFGHALLVTARNSTGTTVLAINCTGGVHTITAHAPHMEGGLSVAPTSFGRYRGDLIGPDESTGRVYAIAPDGTVRTLVISRPAAPASARSGDQGVPGGRPPGLAPLPHGGDIGVESTGFLPPGFRPAGSAYLADRFSRGNKHPGTNSILRLPGSELVKTGVKSGDLLVATEGSARTIDVRCAATCTVRYIAIGLAVSHAEGHIVFTR
jgi:hypothetical protein